MYAPHYVLEIGPPRKTYQQIDFRLSKAHADRCLDS